MLSSFELTEVSRFQRHLSIAYRKLREMTGDTDRTGGYCGIGEKTGQVVVAFAADKPQPEKAGKYYRLVGEKCFRLGSHPDHLTSGQSADEALEQYDGAFRTAPYDDPNSMILVCSGLSSGKADIAWGLLALWNMNEIDRNFTELIGRSNPWWMKLLDEMVG